MGFQKNVLIIALVILSISIIVVASFISKKDKEKSWPPEKATCPPYYDISYNTDSSIICKHFAGGPKPGVTVQLTDSKFEDATYDKDNDNDDSKQAFCKIFTLQTANGAKKMTPKQKCDFSKTCKINWEGYCD